MQFMSVALSEAATAFRAVARRPSAHVWLILTLALGIGAATAMFTIVNTVFLRPLPYPEPDRILGLSRNDRAPVSGELFRNLERSSRSFTYLAAYRLNAGWALRAEGYSAYVNGLRVSKDYFRVLGVHPAAGRTFMDAEDHLGGPRVAVLSASLSQSVFGSTASALGRAISIGGTPHTVIGVMPAGRRAEPAADLWVPLQLATTDNTWNYFVIGRLKPDVTPQAAAGELDVLEADLDSAQQEDTQLAWLTLQQFLTGGGRPAVLLLFGAVLFVLVVAAANAAGLHLLRVSARRRELAARLALGSSRSRLVRGLMLESLVEGMIAATVGFLLAFASLRAILRNAPAHVAFGQAVEIDWRVWLFAALVSLAVSALCTVFPALHATRANPRELLAAGGARQTTAAATPLLRRALLVLQSALAVILLVAAGLLTRTFTNLTTVDLGFEPSRIVVAEMSLMGTTFKSGEDLDAFYRDTLGRVSRIHGVELAGAANGIPIQRGINLPLEPAPGSLIQSVKSVDWRYVTADYLQVMQIPLRHGRSFTSADRMTSEPVALVNEAFARTFFGPADPVGRHVRLVGGLGGDPRRTIVGVIADVKGDSAAGADGTQNVLARAAPPAIYVPAAQLSHGLMEMAHRTFHVNIAARVSSDRDVAAEFGSALKAALPTLAFARVQRMETVVGRALETERFQLTLIAIFAAIAVLLAAVGTYALIANSAQSRTFEVGVRLAVGATRAQILRTFLGEGLVLAVMGIALGVAGSLMLSQILNRLLWNVSPFDAMTIVSVAVIQMVVAGFASFLPARRISRIDAQQALQSS